MARPVPWRKVLSPARDIWELQSMKVRLLLDNLLEEQRRRASRCGALGRGSWLKNLSSAALLAIELAEFRHLPADGNSSPWRPVVLVRILAASRCVARFLEGVAVMRMGCLSWMRRQPAHRF